VSASPPRRVIDYRRLARRNLPSLLTFKFLNEYGYDKGEVVARAIVADICETIRRYYRRKETSSPESSSTWPRPRVSVRGGAEPWPRPSSYR
jgi:hypothetical protein